MIPMKETKDLELRMYFLVPYNISEIQKGIQAGHAAVEYALKFGNTNLFKEFAKNHKTWIILNGGTTNNSFDNPGTLQEVRDVLFRYNSDSLEEINFSFFKEPDLNDALSAICFIADERVFNFTDYPDFREWTWDLSYNDNEFIKSITIEEQKENFPQKYEKWVNEVMGNWANETLRNITRGKRLA